MIRLTSFAAAFLLAVAPTFATAQEVIFYRDTPPTVDELARILFPSQASLAAAASTREAQNKGEGTVLKFRGIRFKDPARVIVSKDPAPRPKAAGEEAKAPIESDDDRRELPSAFAFLIEFEFDSARIPATAEVFLDQLGKALRLPQAKGSNLLIEGHTDAVGSETYNIGLSARRSDAVKRYLVSRHGIDPRDLVTVAKGESEPMHPEEPTSSVNRRVQFRRVQ